MGVTSVQLHIIQVTMSSANMPVCQQYERTLVQILPQAVVLTMTALGMGCIHSLLHFGRFSTPTSVTSGYSQTN